MQKALEFVINKKFKEDLKTLFGEGTKIQIKDCIYSTTRKMVVINSTLLVKEIDESSVSVWKDAMEMMIGESVEYFCLDITISVVSNLDILLD
jgi:hypothetical protein